jgi:glycosyltransferase involved in cell wall biosynthesis
VEEKETATMSKYLLVSSSLSIGGAQRFTVNLANDNCETHITHLICIHESDVSNFKRDLDDRVLYKCIRTRAIKSILLLAKEIKIVRPDVVFTTQAYINCVVLFAKILSRHKCKVVIREASILPSNKNRTYWLSKILYRYADKVIAQTCMIKKDIVAEYGCSSSRVDVLPNYVDRNVLLKKAACFDVDTHGKFTFIFCGRIEKVKNVEYLIESLCAVRDSGYDFNFWIIGDGAEKEKIEERYSSEKYHFVSYMGYQNNPYPYMKAADCILLASEREGFPNVVVEAMALGCIALMNNFNGGAAQEILEKDLSNYIYRSQEDIIKKSIRLLKLDSEKLNELKTEFCERALSYEKATIFKKIFA